MDTSAVAIFDMSDEPAVLRRSRWNPRRQREPFDLRGIVLHQWDTPVGTTAEKRALYGEAKALAIRAMRAPYTISAGVTQLGGEPIVALAHPVERYTYASDAGCSGWLAIGVMGKFPFEEAVRTVAHAAMDAALAAAVMTAVDLAARLIGATHASPRAMITHRQAINERGDHGECPGEAVVAMALRSSAVQLGSLVPDPDLVLVEGHGQVWPPAWRRHLPPRTESWPAPPVVASTGGGDD